LESSPYERNIDNVRHMSHQLKQDKSK